MSTTVRPIREELLAGAFACVSARVDSWQRAALTVAGQFVGETHTDVSEAFIGRLIEEIEASDPFCDHGVGICACDTRGVLEDLRLWTERKARCPLCNGEGFYYDQQKFDLAMAEYAATPYPRGDYPPDESDGYVFCPATVDIP